MVGPSLNTFKPISTIKFMCSYGGRILPRYPDGKLRYHGGETRVLSVERSISYAVVFTELVVKLGEMSGISSVTLRCQLPTEDLDALVSITSDEDLANLIEEYDHAGAATYPSMLSASIKIKAFLSAPKTTKKVTRIPSASSTSSSSSSLSSTSSNDSMSPKFIYSTTPAALPKRCPTSNIGACERHISRPPVCPPFKGGATAGKLAQYSYRDYRQVHANRSGQVYLIHNGNHWQ